MRPLTAKVNVAPGWSVTAFGATVTEVRVAGELVTVTFERPVLPERLPFTV